MILSSPAFKMFITRSISSSVQPKNMWSSQYRFWNGINRVHPKSFTSSEKCTVWIINRTDPSPPYKYTYITYIQWEVPTKNKGWRKIYSQAIEGKNTLCGCIKLLNAGKVYLYIVVFACSKETLTFFVHLTIMKLMGTYNYLLKWNGFLTKEDR